jgi:poly-gamma-glutamate synthase PgsB/CapB
MTLATSSGHSTLAARRLPRLARFAFEDAQVSPSEANLLRKAFAPQMKWVADAARFFSPSGTPLGGERWKISLFVAKRALEECASQSVAGAPRDGERKLRLLAALGAAHDALCAAPAQEVVEAFPNACGLVMLCLNEAQPWLVQDASLRLLAGTLDALPAEHVQAWTGASRSDLELRSRHLAALASSSPWLRESALWILARLQPQDFLKTVRDLFHSPAPGVDSFLRARLLKASDAWSAGVDPVARAGLFEVASRDPSELVRLEAVDAAVRRGDSGALAMMAASDRSVRVKARVAQGLAQAKRAEILLSVSLTLLSDEDAVVRFAALDALAQTAKRALVQGDDALCTQFRTRFLLNTPACELGVLFESLPGTKDFKGALARRWHILHLALHMIADPEHSASFAPLAKFAQDLPMGKTRRLPPALSAPFNALELARGLSLLAVDDFGFELAPLGELKGLGEKGGRWLLTRGHVFGFRLWRFLHELRTPSCDKRQGFSHTIGRLFGGGLHIPSQILCELAQTRVPGEPLYLPEDDGWRPAVPLPDEFLSCVFGREHLRIVTPEGVTTVVPPRGFRARLAAFFALTHGFARFAALRNWTEAHGVPANAYVSAARTMGFEVSFEVSSPQTAAGASLARFFRHDSALVGWTAGPDKAPQPLQAAKTATLSITDPITVVSAALAGAASLSNGFGSFRRFVADANANTLGELLLFLCALTLLFVGSHLWRHVEFRRARASLPLVVGGWGTRGKSGTERLKAALFSSMGFGVVSKTTGCEATLLIASPFGDLREIPLYRPYDKATVWEQHNVVSFASSFGANVFLWECMGLTPDYVRILQRSWMKDDVSTLTNTYPDHEDLQGPAGVNIPQVMTNFVPKASTLCTTEEQMLPFLREEARRSGTVLRAAGWKEAEQIPPEVLSLFPYQEHPYNVALVLEVARVCGVDALFAYKAMSDAVVPDIGVLKTYAPVSADFGRSFTFSNGCSANERHGCTSNWMRLGFHAQDPDVHVGEWVSTFVNNRADRTARSQVFGRVMVFDTAVDRHVLVGSNVTGLVGFYEDALAEYLEGVALWTRDEEGSNDPESGRVLACERLLRHFRHARLATNGAVVRAEVDALVRGLGFLGDDAARFAQHWASLELLSSALSGVKGADKVCRHVRNRLEQWNAFQALSEDIAATPSPCSAEAVRVEERLRAVLKEAFRAKLVVLPAEVQTEGDALLGALVEGIPPGFRERMMGVQNIKGPGLTLLYRLERMAPFHMASSSPCASTSRKKAKSLELKRSGAFWRGVGEFVEPLAAIRRRVRANRVYRDLGTGALSAEDAASRLRVLIDER